MKITDKTTLAELQEYIWHMNIERGFNTEDPSQKMLMMTEEAGELAKAIRKKVGLKFTETTDRKDIEEELADVLIVLLGLASIVGVDMVSAVDDKEAKNRKRTWS